ncbi:hypothetical protein [Azospirillum sp. INR13]|uniref:hypothetical protein n=1 Tax=Azospirillum sp. INR13 TaxID=2596919 RepID=UPI002107ED68|nr:hypothetical protein [Azospirillum sp. INR13]
MTAAVSAAVTGISAPPVADWMASRMICIGERMPDLSPSTLRIGGWSSAVPANR